MARKKKKSKKRRLGAGDRAARKLAEDRERLAAFEVGGSVERPLEVQSASVVESRSRSLGCLHCDDIPRVDAQDVVQRDERVIRAVRLSCPRCRARRVVWVRVVGRTLN